MKLLNLEIAGTDFKVAVANTKESIYKGLSETERLGKNKGLLFIFPKPVKVTMVMRGMNYDLDFIMLDAKWSIIQLGSLNKGDNYGIDAVEPVQMVLEVNKGTIDRLKLNLGMKLIPEKKLATQLDGVKLFKHGGEFEVIGEKIFEVKEDDVVINEDQFQVLDTDGKVVANIEAGARIFSRKDTDKLIKLYKKGDKAGLATLMVAIIKKAGRAETRVRKKIMGLLKKYQSGTGRSGFNPADIPSDIRNLGTYSNKTTTQVPQYSNTNLDDFSIGRSDIETGNALEENAVDNKEYFKKSMTNRLLKEKVVKPTPVQTESNWHNFAGDNKEANVKKGDTVTIGELVVTVTGGYGMRKLDGRETEHSKGVDITTSTGKAHAFQDGVIEAVRLDGDGSIVGTEGKPAAGYYIVVKNDDGSRTQYMHLDSMTKTDIQNLTNKKVSRGDELWPYTTGSGSMSGPHVKIRHYGTTPKYNINPSQLIKGVPYKFIPDGKGGNLLRSNK